MPKKYLFIILGIVLLIIDQLIKWWMMHFHPSLVFFNSGFVFGFIKNPVIGYGLLAIGISILIYFVIKYRPTIYHLLPIILIIAGALSNILDRIFRGYAVDYFNFFSLNRFNLADIYIVLGLIIWLVLDFKRDKISSKS